MSKAKRKCLTKFLSELTHDLRCSWTTSSTCRFILIYSSTCSTKHYIVPVLILENIEERVERFGRFGERSAQSVRCGLRWRHHSGEADLRFGRSRQAQGAWTADACWMPLSEFCIMFCRRHHLQNTTLLWNSFKSSWMIGTSSRRSCCKLETSLTRAWCQTSSR